MGMLDDGPMLWALDDVGKTDGHKVLYGLANHMHHANHEVAAAMHQQFLRPQACEHKAQLSDVLNRWR